MAEQNAASNAASSADITVAAGPAAVAAIVVPAAGVLKESQPVDAKAETRGDVSAKAAVSGVQAQQAAQGAPASTGQAAVSQNGASQNGASQNGASQAAGSAGGAASPQFKDLLAAEDKSATSGLDGAKTQGDAAASAPAGGQAGIVTLPGVAAHTVSSTNAAASVDGVAKSGAEVASASDQVAVGMKHLASTGGSQIQIDITPANLGRVEVRLQLAHDGSVTAAITADRPDTLAMLQNDSKGLEQSLRDAGLRADSGSLTFNLRGGDQGGNQRQNQAFASAYASSDKSGAGTGGDDYSGLAAFAAAQRGLRHDGGLDIQV